MRILLTILISLMFASPCSAFWRVWKQPAGEEASSNCPDWGTYGTATGNILFAWDGTYPDDNKDACDSSESKVDGVLTGATIEGTGAGAYVEYNADNEHLVWAITDAILDSADPHTWCTEVQIASPSSDQIITEFTGDDDSYIAMYVRSTSVLRGFYREGSNVDSVISSSTITTDGSTWNDTAYTYAYNVDGNDHAISVDGSSTYAPEEDDDMLAWTKAESQISIGPDKRAGYATLTRVRRLVILAGYKQTCPSW